MATLNKSNFKFKKHEFIGAESAEDDKDYLNDCFVDTGDIKPLSDLRHPASIIVGRTGVGKTALLLELSKRAEHMISIEPDELALQYISNSSIIKWMNNEGVDLDIFYRLLWRHVLASEMVKLKYNLKTEEDQQGFLHNLFDRFFGDKNKQEALNYLQEWGKRFWENTEYRVHEVTDTLEKEIKSKLGSSVVGLLAEIDGGKKLSSEEKREIVHRAQDVVNQVQVQKLRKVIDILAENVFDDDEEKFYIVIDRLDEKWVDDSIRYRLIRALMETVRELKKIQTVKVVVAIRKDLLARVFKETRNAGFQEEKYQAMMLPLGWDKENLMALVDRRINKLVSRQYTKGDVTWRDIFPPTIDRIATDEYLLNRTLYRPRDVIQFVNCCIKGAVDQNEIKAATVREAESEYSALRLRSLGDEWISTFPEFFVISDFLKGRSAVVDMSLVRKDEMDDLALRLADCNGGNLIGPLQLGAEEYVAGKMLEVEFRRRMVAMMYVTGLVGVKTKSHSVNWSFSGANFLREAEIDGTEKVEICPMFYRVLGIKVAGSKHDVA